MVSTPYQEQRRVMVVTEARQTEDGSAHRMVIAANELSRNGDEVNLRGINFTNYRKNPVVLWSHDSWGGIPYGAPRFVTCPPKSLRCGTRRGKWSGCG